jgi:hypothetical protein
MTSVSNKQLGIVLAFLFLTNAMVPGKLTPTCVRIACPETLLLSRWIAIRLMQRLQLVGRSLARPSLGWSIRWVQFCYQPRRRACSWERVGRLTGQYGPILVLLKVGGKMSVTGSCSLSIQKFTWVKCLHAHHLRLSTTINYANAPYF